MKNRVLIVGNPRETHVGRHLLRGAPDAEAEVVMLDLVQAFDAPRLLKTLWWRLLGHRPFHLESFGRLALRRCLDQKCEMMLATGLAPLSVSALTELRSHGIPSACFLTDDPWNAQHHAPWFMRALKHYAHVFTPRLANVDQLNALNGPKVHYLPFAYAPDVHHPPPGWTGTEAGQWKTDVLFIGGADQERADLMRALADHGFNLSLWGGYWDRMQGLQPFARGHAGPAEFQKLIAAAGVNICLVRRANRDGHSMRSFEIPAIGGCMVVEDTAEHRGIFGPDNECVRYFANTAELVAKIRELLDDPLQQRRLAASALERIRAGRHTYADRLHEMIRLTLN